MSLYLGLVLTSSDTIIPNSSQQSHQARRASGAPNAFFHTSETTPSKVGHIHHSSSVGVPPDTCFFPKGSQCSHPYLWTRYIPTIGTNTRKNPMTPRHHGVCITCLTNKIMLDSPNQLFFLFYMLVPNHPHTDKGQCELGNYHQYKEGHLQSSKIPLLLQRGRNVIGLH